MIEKLNQHFSFTNPASIHDEEALTALELAGRQGKKINEVVTDQNALRETTEREIKNMKEIQIPNTVEDEVQKNINDGTFDDAINDYAGDLEGRLSTLLGSVSEGSTTMDAEVIDLRTDFTTDAIGYEKESFDCARDSINRAFQYVPFPHNADRFGGEINLNHLTTPAIHSFTALNTLVNAPEGVQPSSGDDNVIYVKVEAIDKGRLGNLSRFYPRGIQTIFSKAFDKCYQRTWEYHNVDENIWWGEWKPANVANTFRTITNPVDLNGIVEEDRYIVATTECENAPSPVGGMLAVTKHSHGWVIQNFYGMHTNPVHFYRIGNCPTQSRTNFETGMNVTWSEWQKTKTGAEHLDVMLAGADLNQIVEPQTYTIAVSDSVNKPAEFYGGFNLEVVSFNKGWLVQYAYGLYPNTVVYVRNGKNNNIQIAKNFDPDLDVEWAEWQKLSTMEDVRREIENSIPSSGGGGGGELSNVGYNVVCLGDSIFGNFRDGTGIPDYIAQMTGANVKNFAFGGTRIKDRGGAGWADFDLSRLTSAIKEGTLEYSKGEITSEMPEYFSTVLDEMTAYDWSKVDLYVILSGTNDWYAGTPYGSVQEYMIEVVPNLLSVSPNAKILFVQPPYRNDEWYEMSENNRNADFLGSFGRQLCGLCHDDMQGMYVKQISTYLECGINKYNASRWFTEDDSVHPNATGRYELAKLISRRMAEM